MSSGRPVWLLEIVASACVVVAVVERLARGQTMSAIRWFVAALIISLVGFTVRPVWGWIVKRWPARTPFNPRWLVMDLAIVNLYDLTASEPSIRFEVDVENLAAAAVEITDVKGSAVFASTKSSGPCSLRAVLERGALPLRLESPYRQRITIRQPLQAKMATELREVLTSDVHPIVHGSLSQLELVGTVDGSGPLPPCPVLKDFRMIGPLTVHADGRVGVRRREEAFVNVQSPSESA
jgi:hypothetical protein